MAREELRELGGQRQWAALYAPDAPRGVELRTHRRVATVAGDGACRTLFVHAGTQSARSLPSTLTLTPHPNLVESSSRAAVPFVYAQDASENSSERPARTIERTQGSCRSWWKRQAACRR